MYGTLGAGFMGMMALVFGALGATGIVWAAVDGNYVTLAIVAVAAFALCFLCIREERRHAQALARAFSEE